MACPLRVKAGIQPDRLDPGSCALQGIRRGDGHKLLRAGSLESPAKGINSPWPHCFAVLTNTEVLHAVKANPTLASVRQVASSAPCSIGKAWPRDHLGKAATDRESSNLEDKPWPTLSSHRVANQGPR